jgi:hypothetical protein
MLTSSQALQRDRTRRNNRLEAGNTSFRRPISYSAAARRMDERHQSAVTDRRLRSGEKPRRYWQARLRADDT